MRKNVVEQDVQTFDGGSEDDIQEAFKRMHDVFPDAISFSIKTRIYEGGGRGMVFVVTRLETSEEMHAREDNERRRREKERRQDLKTLVELKKKLGVK